MDLRTCKTPSKSNSKRQELMMMGSSSVMDLMSILPDEILIEILSRLSMKEAARSSVVSHRWESLWRFYQGCMDFEDRNTRHRLFYGMVDYKEERRRYVNWVNQVLESHQGGSSSIQQLRVYFALDKDESTNIDRWIQFAAAKWVRRLEFNFSDEFVIRPRLQTRHLSEAERFYTLPTSITELLKLGGDLKQLASLRLHSVNLADEHVSYFLCNCPVLEELSIVHAPSLSNVRVVAARAGHALRLKHLEIRECKGLQHLEVSTATNLASFKFDGTVTAHLESFFSLRNQEPPHIPNMLFQDVPQLSSLSLGVGDFTLHSVATGFKGFPIPIAQLHTLELDLNFLLCTVSRYKFPRQEFAAQFTNLRQLELSFHVLHEQTMLFVGSCLRASPALHKLVLKYDMLGEDFCCFSKKERKAVIEFDDVYGQLVQGCKYDCLKEVEFLGWSGLKGDAELAAHLAEAAAGTLQRITVDPRNPLIVQLVLDYDYDMRLSPNKMAVMEDARNRARDLLKPKLSPPAELVVL